MPRFARPVVLAALLTGLAAAGITSAQAPKEDKGGAVEVNKDKSGQYRFKVVGADGKAIVQSSKGYATKEDALKAIDSVKSIMGHGKVVEGKEK